VLYNAMIDAAGQWEAAPTLEQADVVRGHAETLKSFVSGSEYADFASLMLARLAVANEEYDAAAAELRAVMESTRDDSLALLARLRLARVEVTRGDATLALALLDQVDPASYKGLYAELKGDIQSLQGDKEAARAAYQLALDALDPTDSRSRAVIELKLNEVMPANVVTANDDEENV
jgi:predicted negative regulator of RcsB-dependent stress response